MVKAQQHAGLSRELRRKRGFHKYATVPSVEVSRRRHPPFCIDKHHQHKTWKRTLKSTWFSTFNHTTTLRRHSARRFRQCQLVIHKKRFRFFGRKSLETGASHKDKHTTHDLPRLTSLPRMPRSCSFAQLPTKVVRLRL